MNFLKTLWPPSAAALAGLLLIAVIGVLGLQLAWVRADLARTAETLERAHADLAAARRDAVAVSEAARLFAERAAQSERAQQDLRRQVAAVASVIDQRLATIERLAASSPEVRAWAEAPLPADVTKLRLRPALSGAQAYRDWMAPPEPTP